MTLLQFPFTGTNGDTATTGNTGAAQVTVSGGATITLATSVGVHGTGMLLTPGATGNCLTRHSFNAASNQVQVTAEFTLPAAAPSTDFALFVLRGTGSPAVVLQFQVKTNGQIQIADAANVIITVLAAGTVVWGQKYRCSLVVSGGSTTSSSYTAKIYNSGSNTALGTASSTTANLTAATITQLQIGSTPPPAAYGVDELQMNDGAGSEIPAYVVTNTPPTVSVTGNQNKATGDTATITVTAADSDGTIASRSLTFEYPTTGAPTITGAGTASPSFPVGATEGVLYEMLETVADDGGATASARTEVRVPITTNSDVRPLAKDAGKTGTFNRVGGSATDGAALTDSSNATYLESGSVSSTGQVARIRLAPRTALGSGAQIGVTLQSDTGTTNWQIRLYQGGTSTVGSGTLRKAWAQSAVGTSWNEYLLTIDDTSLAAISDWGGLYLETEVTG